MTTLTAVSLGLCGWLVIETQQGDALGLAERLSLSAQTSLPFVVALLLWRAHRARSGQERRPASASREALPAGQVAVFASLVSKSQPN
jgi:hypothetical protein